MNNNLQEKIEEVMIEVANTNLWFLLTLKRSAHTFNQVVICGIPINELKNTQAALQAQTAKAEFSSRLATLGEMAAGIAHEINNPLAVIMGNASQLLKSPVNEDNIRIKLEKIVNTCKRITKIINGLKLFSRQSENDPFEMTNLKQIIDDSLELCQEKFYRYGVQLKVDPLPEVFISCRPSQISQVLLNLLNNAFDAVKDLPDKYVLVHVVSHYEKIEIYVSDSGPGIPPQVAEKIFHPFFTTKETGKGTGLGLSISKGIIDDHKGQLELVTEQPLTTFRITLKTCKELSRTA